MKSNPGLLVLILITSTSSMFGLGSVVKKTYKHVPLHYTWEEARQNCKNYNYDLVIIQTEGDEGMIFSQEYYAWIDLTKGIDSEAWLSRAYINIYTWAEGEPQPTDSCAAIFYSSKLLYGFPCDNYFFFICRKGNVLVFLDESKTLDEAWEYCKSNGMKLAKLESQDDITKIVNYDFSLWIQTFNAGSNESDKCATITTQTKTMATRNCSDRLPSLCMTDNVILIKKKKTWEEAMRHCRKMVRFTTDNSRYELVSVVAGKDDAFLRARASQADTEQVWVGLRFLGGTWFWINGEPVENLDLPQCPLPGKNCGVISKTAAHMETADCGEKKNFFCYKL